MKFNKFTLINGIGICLFSIFIILTNQQSTAAPQGNSLTYFPLLHTPAVDLEISNIIITQGVQTANNSVPLVINRPTMVRIFAQVNAPGGISNVSVQLTGSRNGTPFDTLTIGPKTVPESPSEDNLGSTFNAILPASWLDGNVTFSAKVDSTNTVTEADEDNNLLSKSMTFNHVPDLSITVVPIDYTHQGSTGTGFYSGDRVDNISNWIMRTYPVDTVNVKIRNSNFPFVGNLDNGNDWEFLLNEVTTLKQLDLGSVYVPELYYGFIPISDGNNRWFFGGIAGIGWVGGGLRSSIGLNLGQNDDTGSLAAHEIGHNMGRSHAPCNVSGDASYPYGGASIGQFGMDGIQNGTPSLLHPNNYVDMMSYCDPVWISDYTYKALYNDQRANGRIAQRSAEMQESVLIRAQIFADGEIFVKPAYTFPQYPTPQAETADYFVELVNSAGDVVASHPVAVVSAEEPGVMVRSIFTAVPTPDEPFQTVRIVQNGTLFGTRTLSTEVNNQAIVATTTQAVETATVRWGLPEIPAVVRFTANEGVSWTTVGIDVLGGELQVDTSTLPGGGEGRFEVILADSSKTAVIQTTLPSALPNQAPSAWITGETAVKAGTFALLYGHGNDAEDGLDITTQWFINGEFVSELSALSLYDLSAGEYIVTLVVKDSTGQTSSTQQTITITP